MLQQLVDAKRQICSYTAASFGLKASSDFLEALLQAAAANVVLAVGFGSCVPTPDSLISNLDSIMTFQ